MQHQRDRLTAPCNLDYLNCISGVPAPIAVRPPSQYLIVCACLKSTLGGIDIPSERHHVLQNLPNVHRIILLRDNSANSLVNETHQILFTQDLNYCHSQKKKKKTRKSYLTDSTKRLTLRISKLNKSQSALYIFLYLQDTQDVSKDRADSGNNSSLQSEYLITVIVSARGIAWYFVSKKKLFGDKQFNGLRKSLG